MINYLIWCFCSFFHFLCSDVLENKCHKQKWCALFFIRIKLVACLLVCAQAIAGVKWQRLPVSWKLLFCYWKWFFLKIFQIISPLVETIICQVETIQSNGTPFPLVKTVFHLLESYSAMRKQLSVWHTSLLRKYFLYSRNCFAAAGNSRPSCYWKFSTNWKPLST